MLLWFGSGIVSVGTCPFTDGSILALLADWATQLLEVGAMTPHPI